MIRAWKSFDPDQPENPEHDFYFSGLLAHIARFAGWYRECRVVAP